MELCCLISSILTTIVLLLVANILLHINAGHFGENKATSNLGYYTTKRSASTKASRAGMFKDASTL